MINAVVTHVRVNVVMHVRVNVVVMHVRVCIVRMSQRMFGGQGAGFRNQGDGE